ncbi:hypothetical protein MP638_001776 [Amoeboaphelidium occidentale]|nr:hypothetical protein MP638_001776 [Amoeboaphelidium occidentale]
MKQAVKVGFQGSTGAHSEVAIRAFFNNLKLNNNLQHPLFSSAEEKAPSFETHGFEALDDVFAKLKANEISFALLPIENTHSGTFAQLYDLLSNAGSVHIVGEWTVHEQNALLAGTDINQLSDIEEVYSHPHVLEQCSNILNEIKAARKGNLVIHGMQDTANSARLLKEKHLVKAAVIANPAAASVYGLRMLKENVENDLMSATRYLLLAQKPLSTEQLTISSQRGSNKTSVALLLKNSPGMIFKALGCFAFRDINVHSIETRPSPRAYSSLTSTRSPWEYVIYVDIDGGQNKEVVRNALENLREFANDVKIFGSYPSFSSSSGSASPMGGAYGM